MIRAAFISCLAMVGPAMGAVELCDRVTHIAHAGSDSHRDMGRGKVMWVDWWSQEGVFKDVWLADCRSGIALSLRTSEERISDRHIVDRTQAVVDELIRQSELAPAFFTIERMANAIRKQGADLTVAQYDEEFCACAARYPGMRGAKRPYEASQ